MTNPSLSKHLKILEAAGLVKTDKRGQFVFYSLQEDSLTNTPHELRAAGLSGFDEAAQGKQGDRGHQGPTASLSARTIAPINAAMPR